MELVWFCAPATGGEGGWVFDPGQTAGIALVAVLYVRGCRRALNRGARISWIRHLSFGLGLALLLVALLSPLHFASADRLSAHMVQHTILVLAPLLLVMSKVGSRVLQAMPRRFRGGLARLVRPLLVLANPIPAVLILLIVMVVWHIPPVLEAAVASAPLHIAQHLTIVVAAALYWSALLRHRRSFGLSLATLFVLMVVGGAIGALMTFSSVPLYPGYAARSFALAIDWQADQQLAGVVMWVPMGLILMIFGAWLAYQWSTGLRAESPDQMFHNISFPR